MKKWIQKQLRRFFFWIFEKESRELQSLIKQFNNVRANQLAMSRGMEKDVKRLRNIFDNLDVGVDHHVRADSWAVISLQGNKMDYVKFLDLGDSDLREIAKFISRFDRSKIDATPQESRFIRTEARLFKDGNY